MSQSHTLSPLDAAFLYLEGPTQPLHVGCVILLDGRLEFADFARAMSERLAGVPHYAERPVRPALDWHAPTWEPVPYFDPRRHLHHVAVPDGGGTAALQALIETLFERALDHELPLWEACLIDGLADGTSAILLKMHHCMVDGVSGAQVIQHLVDGAQAPAPPARPATAPAPSIAQRLRTGIGGWLESAQGRTIAEAAGTVASLLREPATVLPWNGTLSSGRRVVWSAFALDRFLAVRGAVGCKLNDVVLAVISGALRRYLAERGGVGLDDARVRTLVPVSVRRDEHYMTLGNLVSAMFPSLPVHLDDPLARLRHVVAEMDVLKHRGQAQAMGLLLGLSGALPSPLGALFGRLATDRPIVNTICTNVPGPRETCQLLGRTIVDVHPLVPLFQNMGLEFAIFSYAGRLSITATADPALVPDAERIAEALAAAEAELYDAAVGAAAPPVPLPASQVAVGDLMTAPVVALAPTDTLAIAWRLMQQARIRHLPVVDPQARLVGLVTHRDVLAASSTGLDVPDPSARGRRVVDLLVRDVMETHVAVTTAAEPAATAGNRMVAGKIGCLPVTDATGRLVGIVTEEDFLRWATARMSEGAASAVRCA